MSSMWVLETPQPPPDARIAYGEAPQQFTELRKPKGKGPHPVVLFVHGGFWRAEYGLEHAGHLCADLTKRGFATWSLEYRRVGQAGGGFPGTLEDVASAADHLVDAAPSLGLDLSNVVAMGHSAGGHLAMWLAARHRLTPKQALYRDAPLKLKGVVSLAGVLDLAQGAALDLGKGIVKTFMGGTPEQFPERYAVASPAALQPLKLPQVLLHGTEDDTVPLKVSEGFHARGVQQKDPVHLVPLKGAGHFELIDPRSKEWPRVVQAVRTLR
ncbi:alpha/beta hydrolase [Corallococcus caeni]|uniref:alpha/beta hydrolase family protein n=1 Tax=Corallococcus caeni TaxID=3082388 RepID=UPI002957028B|nr:alpha/beta hydrolase [Corallococcus sp. KH5-1]